MSTGLYTHTTRGTGTILTAAIYNGDHQNHITNANPTMIGGHSDSIAQYQATLDPGGVGTEVLPTNLSGEIERLRFAIKRITGKAQWYEAPSPTVNAASAGTGAFYIDAAYTSLGYPLPNISRINDRMFVGEATKNDGSTDGVGGQTFMADDGWGDWIERNATFASGSKNGGSGVLGFSRKSDGYQGVTVWAPGQVIASAGVLRGYALKIYSSTGAGTTGATGPSHAAGSVSDGGVTWTFVRNIFWAAIGVHGVAISDVSDSRGTWGMHSLFFRKAGGGAGYAAEFGAYNGGSNVSVDPYAILRDGATIGLWLPAGYGTPASVNPCSSAITIGRSDTTWNAGITFQMNGLTGADGSTGTAPAILAGKGHEFVWMYSSTAIGGKIRSENAQQSTRQHLVMGQSSFLVKGVQSDLTTETTLFEIVAPSAGAADLNRFKMTPSASGGAQATLAVEGPDTNLNLRLLTKGTGVVRFGTFSVIAGEVLAGYISILDSAGSPRKLAIIA